MTADFTLFTVLIKQTWPGRSVTRKFRKSAQFFEKVAKKVAENLQNIYIKAQIECPNHLQ
jgi:hypothetical protein